MGIDGSAMTTQATRWRNAMALATDPSSGTVWAGGAGQDDLPQGHPYEFMDAVSAHTAPADYGWPQCEENHVAYTSGANCGNVVVPALEFPAYSTIIGAAFYPSSQGGTYAFPASWRGGLFVACTARGTPVRTANRSIRRTSRSCRSAAARRRTPSTGRIRRRSGTTFLTGFQTSNGNRVARTTGVAVGPQGSLFVADDQNGWILRIRPTASATSTVRRR